MTSRNSEPRAVRPAGAARLLSAAAVRAGGHRLLTLALDDRLDDWRVDLDRLAPTADFVAEVVRERYPRLDVPVHSRWRHFVFAGADLWQGIATGHPWERPADRARAAFDLVITSVLLDAGAGPGWHFDDTQTGLRATRSEGLALASLRWFESGRLATRPGDRYRVDAAALQHIDADAIGAAFQVNHDNPLLGLKGRAALLNRLGAVAEARPELFASEDSPRPGGLYDVLLRRSMNGHLPATTILEVLLEALGPVWQGRPTLQGIPLGDCWPHPVLAGGDVADGYVPLHKLSQWLTYSLIEPLEAAGLQVDEVQALTGLAEYRNGGLFVDMGVITPRQAAAASLSHAVDAPFVVGWRGLTVALLDRLAPLVGDRLGLTPAQFPLPRVLEGGTWAAGRIIARRVRGDGGPPFHVLSDGTVF